MNKKISTVRPELHPVPVKSPWYHLGIDFVGPISPPSSQGNRYILTISDYFTKFTWAKALPTKEAVNVVSTLREVLGFCVSYSSYMSFFIFPVILYHGITISYHNRSRERVQ